MQLNEGEEKYIPLLLPLSGGPGDEAKVLEPSGLYLLFGPDSDLLYSL